jgi:hypothetical protein
VLSPINWKQTDKSALENAKLTFSNIKLKFFVLINARLNNYKMSQVKRGATRKTISGSGLEN